MKKISILGSTGSIGTQALEIIDSFPDRFKVLGLSAGRNIHLLKEQVDKYSPEVVAVENEKLAGKLGKLLKDKDTEVLYGQEGYTELARLPEVDTVISSIVGSAGLFPTFAAISAGKDICLANKESLVIAGELLIREASVSGSRILPVDSEHSAIFQALNGSCINDVKRLIITASGGPFRKKPKEKLNEVTVESALRHPTWKMGKKITIDSSTLINKGFELIEARWLFNVPVGSISIWIHPQSIVHSLVEFIDGSFISQLSLPDMKIPISYALSYPERLPIQKTTSKPADLTNLTFEEVDHDRFPALRLAIDAAKEGGTMPCVMNAANEIAVEAFLNKRINYVEIAHIIEKVMEIHNRKDILTVQDALRSDKWARSHAKKLIN